MLISLKWINELINVENTNLEELIEKLTLGGFEVEDTFEILVGKTNETVLEISATANRADSIFAEGIAKEIGALINKPHFLNPYKVDKFKPETILADSFLKNQIDNDNCSTFITIIAENLQNTSSPKWLKQKLISSEVEPTNDLSDFQNYILLETGYPFEFYNFDKIQEKVNTQDFELTLTTVNKLDAENQYSKLQDDTLILKQNDLSLGIAGICSNEHLQVKDASNLTSIVIEGSIFGSKKIRQTSRKLGLRTDRSARYEKGLNNYNFNKTVCRLLNLLRINNPNITYKINTIAQVEEKPLRSICLNYKNIIEILGPTQINQNLKSMDISIEQITSYLQRLDFEFEFNSKTNSWNVLISKSRVDDITREIDLIEEIGRLHGFNNFISYLPSVKTIGLKDFSYQTRKKLTTCFLSEGLSELMQYSLVKEEPYLQNSVKLINPLISDCSILRTSLLPSILSTLSDNVKQGNRNIEGFEFGHIFSTNTETKYSEKEYVGGNFGGIKTKRTWSESSEILSWFEAKGKLEDIFNKLKIGLIWKKTIPQTYQKILHPYRTAEFYLLDGTSLGIFGQINPIIAKQMSITSNIYLFEFDFTVLKNELKKNLLPLYEEYSSYPKIVKDLSFIVNQNVSFVDIQKSILKTGTNVLIQVKLLDEYKSDLIPSDCISLCVQLTFQSTTKTLRTEEIETILNSIQTMLLKKYKIIQRV